MKSYYEGRHIGGTNLHMVEYFDGRELRQIELLTDDGNVIWMERAIPGILEIGESYRTAKRRLAALEKRLQRRV